MKMRVVSLAAAFGVALLSGYTPAQMINPTSDVKPSDDSARPEGHPKRAMTFADLMAMKRVSDPQISPSGKWVMFSVTDVSLEKNTKVNHLWVMALNPSDQSSPGAPGLAGAKSTTAGPSTSLRSAQDDNAKSSGGERQLTSGGGESNGRFSPDGKTLSLTRKDQIYEMPWDDAAGTAGDFVQVTNVAGGADGAIWSPDSKRLMFVASVYPECSVKGETTTAKAKYGDSEPKSAQNDVRFGQPATWPEEDACDKARDEAAAASPVKGQVWEGLLYRHWDHYAGAKRSHVLVVDADSGRHLRDLTPASVVGDAETPTFSLGGPLGYAWAPDSKEIAYVTNLDAVKAASTNNDVFTLRLDEVGAKAVKVSTSPGSDDAPAYSGDGKYLAFRSQARAGYESDKFRLVVYDRSKGTIAEMFSDFGGWIDEFIWGDRGNHWFFFTSGFEGEERIYAAALGGKPTLIRKGGEFGELKSWQGLGSWNHILVATNMKAQMPAEIVSVGTSDLNIGTSVPDRFGVTLENQSGGGQLTHVNDAKVRNFDLAALESYWFEGAEGTRVQGFIVRPPNFDPTKKYPVKFLIHGGPQGAWGDAWSYRWNAELMAAGGYVVVMVNARGSTGYGQRFVDEVSGDWGGRAYVDLMRGLDAAEAKFPFIDKTRECALGASYGGYMADWVLTHTDRFKCIVTHDGMYDPVSAYGTTEEMWFNEWEFRRKEDFPAGWDGFGAGKGVTIGNTTDGRPGQPWRYAGLAADEDPFRKWSPMRFIENAKTPTLVIHSQKDYRLDVSQGFELYTALQRRGVASKFLYFPDEGHWVLKPQNSQLWYETVGDWCDRWTGTGKYAAGQ